MIAVMAVIHSIMMVPTVKTKSTVIIATKTALFVMQSILHPWMAF